MFTSIYKKAKKVLLRHLSLCTGFQLVSAGASGCAINKPKQYLSNLCSIKNYIKKLLLLLSTKLGKDFFSRPSLYFTDTTGDLVKRFVQSLACFFVVISGSEFWIWITFYDYWQHNETILAWIWMEFGYK